MNPNLTALYGQISWISESPLDGRVLYTGSDDGQVYVTRDGGETWKNVSSNIPGVGPYNFVSSVVASRFARGRVYATFDGHFNNDFRTYVYASEDFGQTWRSIAAGLPTTSVNRIAEHPREANLLVIGHARGAHFSNDRGATWHSLSTNMLDQSSPEASDRPRIEAELNRLVGITGGLMRAVEGFPSAPTADQRQQIQWATEDATRVIAAVNRLGRR